SRRARVAEHWALFVEGTEVKWHFGNPSTEFLEVVSNFLMGLGKLGKELFGTEGIASIIFDRRGHAGLKASEVFIVSLEEKFFLIISDPSVTLLLISAEGGIPEDIQIIMKAVLVGQASILYANMVADVDDDTKAEIEEHFRRIIADINEDYLEDESITNIVGMAGSNFSILTFQELLLLHYYLRQAAERTTKMLPTHEGFSIIANLDGFDIPFAYNITNQGIWAGFFAAIVGFIHSLFESKPRYISFGTTKIYKLRFVFGKDYFMAIDSGLTSDLLLKMDFHKKLFATPYAILVDMSPGIKRLLIEELLQYHESRLTSLSAATLLDTFVGDDDTLTDLSQDERIIRIWGKLLLSFQK
ncbi:MAG: hypothetical protein ACW991_04515, partial [Candidatus Hodarchaeales archaeon]